MTLERVGGEALRAGLAGARVVVVGLGASGRAAAAVCRRLGAHVTGTDAAPRERLADAADALGALGVELALGGHAAAGLDRADLVIVSPGVPSFPALREAESRGTAVIGEIELATRLLPELPVIAITGSNGKSTTTTLVGELLAAAGRRPFVGGNLGDPPAAIVPCPGGPSSLEHDVLVLEISSFQAERVPLLRPRAAALLNVSPNHLDRYEGFEAYVAAKGNVFSNQEGDDLAIVPAGDADCERQARRGRGRVVRFGALSAGAADSIDVGFDRQHVVDRARGWTFDRGAIRLAGDHNAMNVAAALALAAPWLEREDVVAQALARFEGLPHRLAFVREVGGVRFYDDSKGTSVGAAVAAILGLHEAKIVVIVGGRDKMGSYAPLADALRERGRGAVLIGEAADRIAGALDGVVPLARASSMEEAVAAARALARAGDAVLLSPTCSSFDMFRDYKHRGEVFVDAVRGLSVRSATFLPAALATGCGPATPPPDAPAVAESPVAPRPADEGRPVHPGSSDEPGARRPAGPALGPLRHVWTAETGGWSSALLLAPEGDLLSFAARNLRVHARDDGRVLHSTTSCGPVSEDAVAWLDAARFVVVCAEEVRVFTWPGLGSSRLVPLKARVDQAAIGGGVIAVAEDGFFAPDRKGRVLVLSAVDGKVLDEVMPPAEVQSLVVSPDGTSVVFATDDLVQVRDVRARTTRPLREARLAKGFAFSADGRSLFGRFESFDASVVDPSSGDGRGAGWEVGSWITAARWLDARTVVATGSDGLALFPLGQPKVPSPVDDLGEGLAAATDGGVVCAAGRSGRVACFARSAPGPTTMAETFPDRPPRRAEGDAAGSASGPASGPAASDAALDGKLLARQGKTLVVAIDPSADVKVGAEGAMSRPFEQDLGFVVSGWIVVAEVKVVAVDRGRVSLAIVAEKSAMMMNGRPVDHFTPGEVRLSLLPPP